MRPKFYVVNYVTVTNQMFIEYKHEAVELCWVVLCISTEGILLFLKK